MIIATIVGPKLNLIWLWSGKFWIQYTSLKNLRSLVTKYLESMVCESIDVRSYVTKYVLSSKPDNFSLLLHRFTTESTSKGLRTTSLFSGKIRRRHAQSRTDRRHRHQRRKVTFVFWQRFEKERSLNHDLTSLIT